MKRLNTPICAMALAAVLLAMGTPAWGEVRPMAMVNGVSEIYLTGTDKVRFQVSATGEGRVECWVAIYSPFGWFSYNMGNATWTAGLGNPWGGELSGVPLHTVLEVKGLPQGDYYLFFAVDQVLNGEIDSDLRYSMATLHVRSVWRPGPGTTWQWQLTGPLDLSYQAQVYDVDLFDTSRDTVELLHSLGKKVICYVNVGAWEDWRPDANLYPQRVIGDKMEGWEGERWIDIRQISLLEPVLTKRLKLAVEKGCDAIEPDNIDGYTNETGFPLSYQDQLRFNRWIALECHRLGLSVGLKNNLKQVNDLVDHFDWALDESCFQYGECPLLLPFVKAGKAVFGVEYQGEPQEFCPRANAMGFSWMKKHLDLDAWRYACWEHR